MAANTAFADFYKNFSNYSLPQVDFNKFLTTQRKNIEAVSAANQLMTESAQAIARRQSDAARNNVESYANAFRELLSFNPSDLSTEKQAEAAKSIYDNAVSNLQEIGEMCAKSNMEAFNVINKRISESINEFNDAAASATSKKK